MTHNGPPIALDQLGAEIMARIKAGDQAKTKANDHYLAAGLRLLEARDRATTNFPAFLMKHCRGLKRSRAYSSRRTTQKGPPIGPFFLTNITNEIGATNDDHYRVREGEYRWPNSASTNRSSA